MHRQSALIVLSGGLDSAVCLAWACHQGFDCRALSFDYGQLHAVELACAQELSAHFGVPWQSTKIDTGLFAGSALTDASKAVPKDGVGDEIPITYVPQRNLVFLAMASALAESAGIDHIVMGVNAIDYSGYPDCRPEFIRSAQKTLNLASKRSVESGKEAMQIQSPLIDKTKSEIVQMGIDLDVPFELTSSCYDPDSQGAPCGGCDSCRIRAEAFARLGQVDPRVERFRNSRG